MTEVSIEQNIHYISSQQTILELLAVSVTNSPITIIFFSSLVHHSNSITSVFFSLLIIALRYFSLPLFLMSMVGKAFVRKS